MEESICITKSDLIKAFIKWNSVPYVRSHVGHTIEEVALQQADYLFELLEEPENEDN